MGRGGNHAAPGHCARRSGRGKTLASKVIDPLYAQVLYLKDGKGTGFVLASFDLIGLPHDLSDRIRTRMVHELGVDWNLVVLKPPIPTAGHICCGA